MFIKNEHNKNLKVKKFHKKIFLSGPVRFNIVKNSGSKCLTGKKNKEKKKLLSVNIAVQSDKERLLLFLHSQS